MTKFVHLHNHSHYSLLDGLNKIDEMVAQVKALGMDAIALTDHGNLYGAVEFYKKAKKAGIKPILGVEAYMAPASRFEKGGESVGGRLPYYHLVLLAKNEKGWKNLMKIVSRANMEGFYYKPRADKELLRELGEGIIALSACLSGEVARLLLADKFNEAERVALEYKEIFGDGNFYLEVGAHPRIKEAVKVKGLLVKLSEKTGIPLVATQDIHYLKKEDADYHDILLAVQTGNRLNDPDRMTLKGDDFSMRSPEEMEELFRDIPQAIENTAKIADMCNVELELGKILLPSFPTPNGEQPMDYLRKLTEEKWPARFKEKTPQIEERTNYELAIIEKMGFADYFLIVQDFVNWAKNHGIVVGPGRGSAAGSLLSYILGITDIDPLKYDLLFERFLNPERIQMPDFDIDFADKRRDEVLGYVKQRYGEDKVAQIITFGTMAARAALRDAGRALGMSYGFCDKIAKLIPFNPTQGMKSGWLDKCLENVAELKNLNDTDPEARRLIDTARKLEGVARHASVHACATVISKEPLIERVPLQFAPQGEKDIITQFEMHSVEDLGLLKMDFLGLKNLTIIEDALRLIEDMGGPKIKISELPLDDQRTFELLRAADTVGVFQFESSGMRRYMKELRPTELEDLIALVALFRPGPMELIPTYIKRKHGEEKITSLHPTVDEALKSTYGVIVYQEQVMDMATKLAGLSRGEGYLLIKAVGKKIKTLLDEQKGKFINGCIKNNISSNIANKTWELIEPFARYGFNKAHSACYALIGYQTAYLKAHYPVEFMSSLLNADSGDVERVSFLVNEAKKMNIQVLPPDVNKSMRDFMPDDANIRFGLLAIKNVGEPIVLAIAEERARGGPFKTFSEFLTRVNHKDLNKKSLESLIKCGGFDSMGIERNEALANIEDILKFTAGYRKSKMQAANSLFGASPAPNGGTLKLKPTKPAMNNEKLAWEKELIGLYVSDHPLKQHAEKIQTKHAKTIRETMAIRNEQLRFNTAGLISTIKRIIAKNGKPMLFARLEDLSDAMEVIVFNDTLARCPEVWKENNAILLSGRMSWRDNDPKIICDSAEEL